MTIRFGPICARDLALGALATLIDAAARVLTVFNHVFSLDLDNNLKDLKRDIRAWFTWLKEQRPAANELIEEEPA